MSRAILLRSILFAVLLFFLLRAFQGSVDFAFLAVSVFAVLAMHEALHMVGMEALGTRHAESFKVLAVGYAALDVSLNRRVVVALLAPFLVMFPFGFLLIQTGLAAFVALGWGIVILHGVLLPIELATTRRSS